MTLAEPTNKPEDHERCLGSHPTNITVDPVIVDLQSRVGSIKESNLERDTQQAETMRVVAEHGKILVEKAMILANHDRRINFHYQILSD